VCTREGAGRLQEKENEKEEERKWATRGNLAPKGFWFSNAFLFLVLNPVSNLHRNQTNSTRI
jgi:hypothetical protein